MGRTRESVLRLVDEGSQESLLVRNGRGTDAPDRNGFAIQEHQERGDEDALFGEQDDGVRVVSREDEEAR